jgi:hypothetical protein
VKSRRELNPRGGRDRETLTGTEHIPRRKEENRQSKERGRRGGFMGKTTQRKLKEKFLRKSLGKIILAIDPMIGFIP